MNLRVGDLIALVGTYLYAGVAVGDLRIVRTNVRLGSGDPFDEPDVRDDQPGRWFDVQYTAAGERGKFTNAILGFPGLQEARAWAESQFTGIAWLG